MLFLCVLALLFTLPGCRPKSGKAGSENACTGEYASKPVIYLYPVRKTDVSVKLDYGGRMTCTYPESSGEWKVTAYPGGRLVNRSDGKEYSYLYWEGESDVRYDLSKGFVVAGGDTAAFLQEKLSFLGLTPKEYNEMIVYWLPKMQNHPYNLIAFQSDAYTDSARLVISPKPDAMLRVFMTFRPLGRKISLPEQPLRRFERKGFTVVEWGGCELRE